MRMSHHIAELPFMTLVTMVTWMLVILFPKYGYCFYINNAHSHEADKSAQVITEYEQSTENSPSRESGIKLDNSFHHKSRHHQGGRDSLEEHHRNDNAYHVDNAPEYDPIQVPSEAEKLSIYGDNEGSSSDYYSPSYGDDEGSSLNNDYRDYGDEEESSFHTDYSPSYGEDEQSSLSNDYPRGGGGEEEGSSGCGSAWLMNEERACTQAFIAQYATFARVPDDHVTSQLLHDICRSYGLALECLHLAFQACPPGPEHLAFMSRHLPEPALLRPLCFPPTPDDTRQPTEIPEHSRMSPEAADTFKPVRKSTNIPRHISENDVLHDESLRRDGMDPVISDNGSSKGNNIGDITETNLPATLHQPKTKNTLHVSQHKNYTETNDIKSYIVQKYPHDNDHEISQSQHSDNKNTQGYRYSLNNEGNNDYPRHNVQALSGDEHSSPQRRGSSSSQGDLSAVSHSLRDSVPSLANAGSPRTSLYSPITLTLFPLILLVHLS